MPKRSPAPRQLVHTSIRLDRQERDDLIEYLRLEDPDNTFPAEMRRLVRQRLKEAKARVAAMENGRAA